MMIQISCPSCGERGKIPATLVGVRIKCKKCGGGFQVVAPDKPPVAVSAATVGVGASAAATSPPIVDGIVVEGLDPTAWTIALDHPPQASPTTSEPHREPTPEPTPPPSGTGLEYKLLTSRDKYFEGKFDLSRLEEALNHYARQGWVARSMCLPHVKNFQGAMHEEIVVLLER